MAYTKEYLLNKLNELWKKYGIIQTKLIDSEPNFPTRKCYTRVFGSLEKACLLIGYKDYHKRTFNIEDAQKVLDKRNGYFTLLTFNGMGNKCSVQCKKCETIYELVPDSLIRNKTDEHFGCKNCNLSTFFEKLKHNNLKPIKQVGENRYKVMCLKCGSIIEGAKGNLSSLKYICPYCESNIKITKINNNKELFATKTVKRNDFIIQLSKIISEESLQWYYCLGFFMADGSFNKDTKRLSMWLSNKDINIINKIASFLGCEVKKHKEIVGIDFCNDRVSDLIDKYDINNQKTYCPCNISSIKSEKLIAFIIGFVDGDGSILQRTDNGANKITIKIHVSWQDNLKYMTEGLYTYFHIKNIPKPYIVNQNQKMYASVTWGNQFILSGLSDFITKNNLFVLQRKWSKLFVNKKGA